MFFGTMNAIMPAWLKTLLYLAILDRAVPLRPRDGHLGLAHALRLLARRRHAGRLGGARQGQPDLPHAGQCDLDGCDPRDPVRVSGASSSRSAAPTSTPSSSTATLMFLFLSFTIPIVLGMMTFGTPKWPRWDRGTSAPACSSWFACCRSSAWSIIFFIAIQPPNDKVLWITIGFIVLTAILWFALREPPLPGPADRRRDRQAPGRQSPRPSGRSAKPAD